MQTSLSALQIKTALKFCFAALAFANTFTNTFASAFTCISNDITKCAKMPVHVASSTHELFAVPRSFSRVSESRVMRFVRSCDFSRTAR